MVRFIGPLINWIIRSMLSRLFKLGGLRKIKSWRNVPSTRSTYSPTSRKISISSSTSICLRLPTTSTLSMSTATEVRLKECSGKIESYLKNRHYSFSSSLLMLFRFLTSTTSCIGILSLITSFSIRGLSSWVILDSVRVWKKLTWQKLCLDHPSTWLHKSWEEKSTALKQTSGHLELFSMRCFTVSVHLSQQLFPNWSKSSRKQSSNSQPKSPYLSKQNVCSEDYWQRIQQKE